MLPVTYALPLLPTMGVGSYAAPGWFLAASKLARAGEFGPHDVEELFEDATRVVIEDQIDAGLDIITDGELMRQRFVYEVCGRLSGVERLPATRKLGVPAYDTAPRFVAQGKLSAPGGLGVVAEFRRAARIARGRLVKVALPGALSFALPVQPGGRSAASVLDDLIAIVRQEIHALVEAGASYIQLDEPGLATGEEDSKPPEMRAEVINATLEGFRARTAVHVCFGNNAGRPTAARHHRPLLSALERLRCDQLVLEFANREMSEVELLGPLGQQFEIAAGVIDVKNFHVEHPQEVATRLDRVLGFVPPPRLTATADCGLSALPRYIAKRKMRALVEGTRLVRARLDGRVSA
jgi:5-methyltetrahydropteroyltriglutamate--homocysteine methyltransferase